jgi:hypothetical protein
VSKSPRVGGRRRAPSASVPCRVRCGRARGCSPRPTPPPPHCGPSSTRSFRLNSTTGRSIRSGGAASFFTAAIYLSVGGAGAVATTCPFSAHGIAAAYDARTSIIYLILLSELFFANCRSDRKSLVFSAKLVGTSRVSA